MADFSTAPRVLRTRRITLAPEERIPQPQRTRYIVRLSPRPYWQEMGWQRDGSVFTGHFRAMDRTFAGYIVRAYVYTWEYFVLLPDPWPALRNHHKWGCFQLHDERGWRKLHWNKRPRSLDSGIQGIEQILAEALRAQGG